MKSYVWLTFAFMGWGYYEMSGGADFVPQERVVASVEEPAVTPVETPEIVARAANAPTLLAVSASNVATPAPEITETAEVAVAPLPQADQVEEPAVTEVVAIAPAVEEKLDIRAVGSSRVNMRMGPGTNFDVITTLDSGTKLEILEVNPDGWANVSTVDRGIEGWMAERLLTAPET